MLYLLRAIDWTGLFFRRYIWDTCIGFVRFVFGWIGWQLSRVGGACWSVTQRVFSRLAFHVGAAGWWIWSKTFGSQRVQSAAATTEQAREMALGLGAQKLHELSETSIWQRSLSFFPNVMRRVSFALGFVGWWLWTKTVGSKTVSAAAETAGAVPKQAIGFGLHNLDRAAESTLGRRVAVVLRIVFAPFFAVLEFMIRWLFSRNYRMLRGGIPVAILALPFAYILVRLPFVTVGGQAATYQRAAVKAREDEDDVAAALFERKLVQLGIADARHEYYKALQNEAAVGIPATYAAMVALAPHDDRAGFALAHRWIAIALSQGIVQPENDQDLDKLLVHHLSVCLASYPYDAVTLQLMAARLSEKRDFRAARELLGKIALTDLPAADLVRLASSFQRCDDHASAERVAGRASILFEEEDVNTFSADDVVLWAAAEKMIGNYAKMVDVLGVGLEHLPDEHHVRFADICVLAIHDSWTATTTHEKFFDVAKRAIRLFPESKPVGDAIAEHCTSASVARLRTVLAIELDNGTVHPSLHGRIADQLALIGLLIEARSEYATVYKHNRDARIANNLAWLWATVEPTDLTKAMNFIEEAREIDPDASFVLETRGQIFFMLERYAEAKRDLTLAMNGLPNYEPIHDTLAKCYEKLGQPQLARQHREASDRLKRNQQN